MSKLLELLNQNRQTYELYFPLKEWGGQHGEMGLYRRRDSDQLYGFFTLGEFIVYSIEWNRADNDAIAAAMKTMTNLATFAGAVPTDQPFDT